MRRFGLLAAILIGLAGLASPVPAQSQDGVTQVRPIRATTRVYIYPRSQPGPNSRRICNAWMVQEYRPSGTVITPQMRCYWD